jgi:replicative DNA helicase
MFIDRDILNEDVEKRNKAKIIVAKHRNGPTSSGIDVVFRNNLTQFDNIANKRD